MLSRTSDQMATKVPEQTPISVVKRDENFALTTLYKTPM